MPRWNQRSSPPPSPPIEEIVKSQTIGLPTLLTLIGLSAGAVGWGLSYERTLVKVADLDKAMVTQLIPLKASVSELTAKVEAISKIEESHGRLLVFLHTLHTGKPPGSF